MGNTINTHSPGQSPPSSQDLGSELAGSSEWAPGYASVEDHQEVVEHVLTLQQNLESMSRDDPERPEVLFLTGCAIADHHIRARIDGLGDMGVAIETLEEAIAATPEEKIVRRTYCNALQNMRWTAYQATRDTGDKTYLDESIKYGRLAVGPKFPSDLEDPHTLLSQRYALPLSRSLKEKFEMSVGDQQNVADLDEALALLTPALPGEAVTDHDARLWEVCCLKVLKAEATHDITLLDGAIRARSGHSMDISRGGYGNARGLVALLGRRYEWTMEEADLDNLVQMSRLGFKPEVAEDPDYTIPLEYSAMIAGGLYRREGRKLFDLDTAICLQTIALLQIKRDSFSNLQRRRAFLEEVGRLLDDRWKLKGEERDGYAADEADLERGQIESILPLLGDGTVPLEQCGPFGFCTNYTSRVTGEYRVISGFRIVFRRSLKPGEEWEESDVWSSSVPDGSSDSQAGSAHSGDEGSDDDVKSDMAEELLPDIDGNRSSRSPAGPSHSGDEVSDDDVRSDQGEEHPPDIDEDRISGSQERPREERIDDFPTRTANRL